MTADRRAARFGPGAEAAGSVRSPYPPIADYAYLSDCEVNALIAPSGNVEWLCLPRPDSPSVFGSILDRDAGGFRFGPSDVLVPAARRYIPGTMIVETSWNTPTGWAIVRDVLLMGPWQHEQRRDSGHLRAPTDYDAEHMLLRTVRCVNGEIQLTLDCEPVFDYGRHLGEWSFTGHDYRQGTCRTDASDVVLTLTSDINLGFEGPRAMARTLVKEGETRFVALSWGAVQPPTTYDDAYRRQVWTAHHWQHWLARGHFPDHPWRAYLERVSAHAEGPHVRTDGSDRRGGHHVTAGDARWRAQLGLPLQLDPRLDVRPLGSVHARLRLGGRRLHELRGGCGRGLEELQVMYAVGGERELTELTLDHLEGYDGARPVRIGNGAFNQRQHDVWGAVLDSFYLHTRSRDRLDDRVWAILVRQVEQALEHWRSPDRGIWEVRGEPRHFTSSKVMCWVAADRGARLARLRNELEYAERWQAAADEIHAEICAKGVDERGVFTQHYDTKASTRRSSFCRWSGSCRPTIRASVPPSSPSRTS